MDPGGEPAIVLLQERVVSQRSQDTIAVNPPAYDPQSNGVAEKIVQDVKAQLRVLKVRLEARKQHSVVVENHLKVDDTTCSRCCQSIQRREGRRGAHSRL